MVHLGTFNARVNGAEDPIAARIRRTSCPLSTWSETRPRRVLRRVRHHKRAGTVPERDRDERRGPKPAEADDPDGWHIAAAQGLPERFITSVAIDPSDATKKTVYVSRVATAAGGSRRERSRTRARASAPASVQVDRRGANFTDVSGNLPDVPATWVTLRGKQLIVGTDVGVFSTKTKGKAEFVYLNGLPVVPISTMNRKPDNPNLLVVATYDAASGRTALSSRCPVPRRVARHAAAAARTADRTDWGEPRGSVRVRGRG